MMAYDRSDKRAAGCLGLGFVAWFIFCLLLSIASIVLTVWLVIAAIGYLDRGGEPVSPTTTEQPR